MLKCLVSTPFHHGKRLLCANVLVFSENSVNLKHRKQVLADFQITTIPCMKRLSLTNGWYPADKLTMLDKLWAGLYLCSRISHSLW